MLTIIYRVVDPTLLDLELLDCCKLEHAVYLTFHVMLDSHTKSSHWMSRSGLSKVARKCWFTKLFAKQI